MIETLIFVLGIFVGAFFMGGAVLYVLHTTPMGPRF